MISPDFLGGFCFWGFFSAVVSSFRSARWRRSRASPVRERKPGQGVFFEWTSFCFPGLVSGGGVSAKKRSSPNAEYLTDCRPVPDVSGVLLRSAG